MLQRIWALPDRPADAGPLTEEIWRSKKARADRCLSDSLKWREPTLFELEVLSWADFEGERNETKRISLRGFWGVESGSSQSAKWKSRLRRRAMRTRLIRFSIIGRMRRCGLAVAKPLTRTYQTKNMFQTGNPGS